MNKIIEQIKISVEKDFLTKQTLDKAKQFILNKLNKAELDNISASFTNDSFSITISDINDNKQTFSGKISPSLIKHIITFIDEIFKDNVNWDDVDFVDSVNISLSIDFVDGKFIEHYDSNTDKTTKTEYTLNKIKTVEQTNIEDNQKTQLIFDNLSSTELTQVIKEFTKFFNKNFIDYDLIDNGFIINKTDIRLFNNILNKLHIDYNLIDVINEQEKIEEDKIIIDENKIVAMDFEVINKNEAFVLVFEEKDKNNILQMVAGKQQPSPDLNFEYIQISETEIIEEHGNRLFRDTLNHLNIELVNKKRILI